MNCQINSRTTLIIVVIVCLLVPISGSAQDVKSYNDGWFLLLNHYQLNSKWTIGNEFHLRRTDFFKEKEQMLFRPFLNYNPNEKLTYTVGYTYIKTYPYNAAVSKIIKPEHNIWEQITIKQQLNKTSLSHRYRLEHRFLGVIFDDNSREGYIDHFSFSNRFRYRFTIKRTLSNKFFVQIFNEVWIKSANNFGSLSFDRNWIYLGLGRQMSKNGSVQLAYLHQNIKLSGTVYEVHPTLQFTIQYDFAKSQTQKQ